MYNFERSYALLSLESMIIMKRRSHLVVLIAIALVPFHSIQAQRLQPRQMDALKSQQDSLKVFAKELILGAEASNRFRADSSFIRGLMRALQIPYSFDFKFDSLTTISIQYPPDSSFRIFTWQLMRDEDYYRHKGVIQMNTKDGKLLRYPLFDVSDFTEKPEDSVRNVQNWIGALYYKIIQTTHNSRPYYTLLGFDDNDMTSTKKWIEVLQFSPKGEPVFGAEAFFTFKDDTTKMADKHRFSLEYKKDGRARMNFDQDLQLIIYDHLISETNEPARKSTLIPDGDYEGFVWKAGKWLHVDKVFDFQLRDGEAPIEKPVY